MKTLNELFLSLPSEQQKILTEDKWMLANWAFNAGRSSQNQIISELAAVVRIQNGNLYGDINKLLSDADDALKYE
jgi:hypothetical protein